MPKNREHLARDHKDHRDVAGGVAVGGELVLSAGSRALTRSDNGPRSSRSVAVAIGCTAAEERSTTSPSDAARTIWARRSSWSSWDDSVRSPAAVARFSLSDRSSVRRMSSGPPLEVQGRGRFVDLRTGHPRPHRGRGHRPGIRGRPGVGGILGPNTAFGVTEPASGALVRGPVSVRRRGITGRGSQRRSGGMPRRRSRRASCPVEPRR
jgi:hypothetical protein